MDEHLNEIDSLKPLEEIFSVDPRNKHYDIKEWHLKLSEISLNANTPIEVKQLFENAKNIALFTYFSYRLHQSAETIAYSALEQALKMKFEQERGNINFEKKPRRLEHYMNIALEQGWITDEGYESSRNIAISRVEHRKISELMKSESLKEGVEIPVPEPSEIEVLEEMKSMRIAERHLHTGRHIRNSLVHEYSG
ncbi:hypothetical protein HR45_14815 [Shewanella mangrovi]|uniref:Uncharacterized protein n=1 Tax=Shewanella mangrovi TaxID=1515746 RepID=A0A094JFA8_9GAMM|nr:hypothetical protein [Shewanella mangrovi]KFZ36724.1 hypothetical protein HR45_14815 [Shewanella mangrovi]